MKYLTADELAARWRCRKMTIYTMAKNKEIPFVRVGRKMLFELAKIEEIERLNSH